MLLFNEFGIKELHSTPDSIVLCQQKFSRELLIKSGLDTSRVSCTPLPVQLKLSTTYGDLLLQPETYRTMVGKFVRNQTLHQDIK